MSPKEGKKWRQWIYNWC